MQELKKGVFAGWLEGTLNFAPTYKYEINSEKYYGEDPKAGKRKPAWYAWFSGSLVLLSCLLIFPSTYIFANVLEMCWFWYFFIVLHLGSSDLSIYASNSVCLLVSAISVLATNLKIKIEAFNLEVELIYVIHVKWFGNLYHKEYISLKFCNFSVRLNESYYFFWHLLCFNWYNCTLSGLDYSLSLSLRLYDSWSWWFVFWISQDHQCLRFIRILPLDVCLNPCIVLLEYEQDRCLDTIRTWTPAPQYSPTKTLLIPYTVTSHSLHKYPIAAAMLTN